jgi:hypothetical protein
MSSPRLEVFFLFESDGVTPLTGHTGMTFTTYKNDLGDDLAQPTVTEIGGGAYKFTILYPDDRGVIYVLDTDGANPAAITRFARVEDYAAEAMGDFQDGLDAILGKWEIKTTGADANRLVMYRQDGSVLKKFNLYDRNGLPTSVNPFKRDPVP